MTIAAGVRLGPYEILAPLGSGGMGEVYRAKDTRLDRDVAIKILPDALAQDAPARARFDREAKAVAALSHPNILAIHDVGSEGPIAYAVMELLEGETLRSRLVEGPLPPRKALEIGREIAQGLAAAHEKEIVHRDLKPENLFLTRGGHVKILDFGLARQAPTMNASDTRSPTVAPDTEPGTVLGTVGYMSPEQVKGRPADARSDIFSFGAVLFEMLSGRRAFQRGTAAETMTAILREDPPDLSVGAVPMPPAVERIVRHCLEKEPDDRFRSAHDLAFALDAVSGSATVSTRVADGAVAPSPRPFRTSAALAVLAALGLALGAGWLLGRGRTAPRLPVSHRITFRRGFVSSAVFTPDGQGIVYSASWEGEPYRLYSTRVDSSESRPLDVLPARILATSRSGELAISLGASRDPTGPGMLARLGLGGGAPRPVEDGVVGAAFAPDGGEVAIVRRLTGGRSAIEYPPGKAVYASASIWSGIAFTPDGKGIAFAEDRTVYILDLATGKKGALWSGSSAGVQNGRMSWRGRELWFAGSEGGSPPCLRTVDRAGVARVLYKPPSAVLLCDVAPDGRVLYSNVAWRAALVCATRDRTKEQDLSWLDWSIVRDISPDGRLLLINEFREGGGGEGSVYARPADGSPAVRLGAGYALALSPDGALALARNLTGPTELRLYPTGAGVPVRMPLAKLGVRNARFFPDGRRVALLASEGDGPVRLYTLDIPNGTPRAFSAPVGVGSIAISPDGAAVAATTSDGHVALFPVAGGEPRQLAGFDGKDVLVGFSADGASLYVAQGQVPAHIFRVETATGTRTLFKEISPDPTGVARIAPFVVTPDGSAYAYSIQYHTSDLYLLEGLVH